jgi:hypothetical protein
LKALPVRVDAATVRVFSVPVEPYEGGARPSSELVLEGMGRRGRGEDVAWTLADHRAFAGRMAGYTFEGAVGEAVSEARFASLPGYDRCAAEGALIDLALQQSGLTWADVTGQAAVQRLKTWVSFDRCPDPAARMRSILASNPGAHFKIDVDPGWTADTLADLAAVPGGTVGVLDFKHASDATALCRRARDTFPDALFEDPPVALAPCARDQVVLKPADARVAPGERVNLKGPRMGGWFAVLDALSVAAGPVYFGGMFELGVGRTAARLFAAAFAPDAWHDLAEIPPTETAPRAPVVVDPTAHAFS